MSRITRLWQRREGSSACFLRPARSHLSASEIISYVLASASGLDVELRRRW